MGRGPTETMGSIRAIIMDPLTARLRNAGEHHVETILQRESGGLTEISSSTSTSVSATASASGVSTRISANVLFALPASPERLVLKKMPSISKSQMKGKFLASDSA